MDNYLNILQSVQLPFALIPMIKFVGCPKIMGSFALPRWQIIAASIFGFGLFCMNITIIVKESSFDSWGKIISMAIGISVYVYFLLTAILEPTKPLRELTEEELNNYDGDKIVVYDQGSNSNESLESDVDDKETTLDNYVRK